MAAPVGTDSADNPSQNIGNSDAMEMPDIGCADAHIVLSLSNAVPADLPSPLSSVKSRRAARDRQSDKGESSEYCTPLSGSVSASRRAMKNCCADGVEVAHRI